MNTLQTTAHRLAWLRVLTLAVAAFVFNTTEFVPIALLSDIGAGFSMSAAATGVMMTVYAWIVSLASLPCMLLVARRERRALLLALFALFIASHIATALAVNFAMLLAARAGVALAHAIFWQSPRRWRCASPRPARHNRPSAGWRWAARWRPYSACR